VTTNTEKIFIGFDSKNETCFNGLIVGFINDACRSKIPFNFDIARNITNMRLENTIGLVSKGIRNKNNTNASYPIFLLNKNKNKTKNNLK